MKHLKLGLVLLQITMGLCAAKVKPPETPATLGINHFPNHTYAYAYNQWGNQQFYPALRRGGKADPHQASFEMLNYYLTYAQGSDVVAAACTNKKNGCTSLYYMNTDRMYVAGLGPDEPASCKELESTPLLERGNLELGMAPFPETAFVHVAGPTPSRATRVRGFYGDRGRCHLIGYKLLDSSPAVIDHWNRWLAKARFDYLPVPNTDIKRFKRYTSGPVAKLGGFFHDDMPQSLEDGTYFPSGGGCAPFTGRHGSGTSICRTTREIRDDAEQIAAYAKFIASIKRPDGTPMAELINGCPAPGGTTFYNHGPQVGNTRLFTQHPELRGILLGCMAEGTIAHSTATTPSNQAVPGIFAKNMQAVINNISVVTAAGYSYELLGYGSDEFVNGSEGNIRQRLTNLGILWLAYTPGTNNVIDGANFDNPTGSGLYNRDQIMWPFWVEQFMIPWDPVQTMLPYQGTPETKGTDPKLHGEQDLRVATIRYQDPQRKLAVEAGVWCREFRQLWLGHRMEEHKRASLIGRVAVCVNSANRPVPVQSQWLREKYTHVITPVGGDLLDPKAHLDMYRAFVAGKTEIPAGSALFVMGKP